MAGWLPGRSIGRRRGRRREEIGGDGTIGSPRDPGTERVALARDVRNRGRRAARLSRAASSITMSPSGAVQGAVRRNPLAGPSRFFSSLPERRAPPMVDFKTQIKDLKAGDGPAAKAGDIVTVHY